MVFNSKSNLLLRRLDIRHIMDVLMVKDAVDLLLSKVEVLKHDSVSDYQGFAEFFKHLTHKD